MVDPTLISEITSNPTKGVTLKQEWRCPHCGIKIITYVTLTEPPSHRCEKKAQRPTNLQPKGNQ